MNFFDRLHDRIRTVDSVVSVGLDPDQSRIPDHLHEHDLPRWAFNRRIIDATHEHAAVFKPNAAFYEDPDGWRALEETVAYAHGKGVPRPARRQARRYREHDAAVRTAARNRRRDHRQPLHGTRFVAAVPFLANEEAGVFVLCRTSNPGGADLQDLELETGESVYERVAALADLWNENDNVGLVVARPSPRNSRISASRCRISPSSSPESGAQGGDAEAAIEYGLADGVGLVNSSRGIIFAGEGRGEEFATASGQAAKRLKKRLNQSVPRRVAVRRYRDEYWFVACSLAFYRWSESASTTRPAIRPPTTRATTSTVTGSAGGRSSSPSNPSTTAMSIGLESFGWSATRVSVVLLESEPIRLADAE